MVGDWEEVDTVYERAWETRGGDRVYIEHLDMGRVNTVLDSFNDGPYRVLQQHAYVPEPVPVGRYDSVDAAQDAVDDILETSR